VIVAAAIGLLAAIAAAAVAIVAVRRTAGRPLFERASMAAANPRSSLLTDGQRMPAAASPSSSVIQRKRGAAVKSKPAVVRPAGGI
jgi:hypothetical protein